MKTRLAALILLVPLAVPAAWASATPAAAAAEKPAPAATATPQNFPTEFKTETGAVVKRSMTAAEVLALLGEPKEKRPMKAGDEMAEIWVYRRETVKAEPKTLSSDTIVTDDNGQGFVKTVSVPTYRLEQTTIVETRELLMYRGRLLNWKETRGVKRAVQ